VTRRLLLFALVLLAFVGTACGRYLTTGVAVVNGVSISNDELDKQFKAVAGSQQFSGSFDKNNPQQVLEIQRQIIVTLIQKELIKQEAVNLKIHVSDAQVAAGLQQVRSQFTDDAQFQQALAQNKLTLADLRTQIRDQALLDQVRARATGTTQVTDAEIAKAYGSGSQFEEIRVRHIFFQVTGQADLAAKKKKAEDALKQLKAGADFATLAKKISEDPGSKAKGGDLGYFGRDVQFDQQFLQAAFALKKNGELSGVVQSSLGFHIIQLVNRRTKTLAQARAQLVSQISQQKQQDAFTAFIKKLLGDSRIVVNPKYGDFDAKTLSINAHQFFVPPTPAPQTQPFATP